MGQNHGRVFFWGGGEKIRIGCRELKSCLG